MCFWTNVWRIISIAFNFALWWFDYSIILSLWIYDLNLCTKGPTRFKRKIFDQKWSAQWCKLIITKFIRQKTPEYICSRINAMSLKVSVRIRCLILTQSVQVRNCWYFFSDGNISTTKWDCLMYEICMHSNILNTSI